MFVFKIAQLFGETLGYQDTTSSYKLTLLSKQAVLLDEVGLHYAVTIQKYQILPTRFFNCQIKNFRFPKTIILMPKVGDGDRKCWL